MDDANKPSNDLKDLQLAVSEIRDAIRNMSEPEETGEHTGEVSSALMCGGCGCFRCGGCGCFRCGGCGCFGCGGCGCFRCGGCGCFRCFK